MEKDIDHRVNGSNIEDFKIIFDENGNKYLKFKNRAFIAELIDTVITKGEKLYIRHTNETIDEICEYTDIVDAIHVANELIGLIKEDTHEEVEESYENIDVDFMICN